jgi:hypothetical protein
MPTVAELTAQTSAAATDIILIADATTGAAKKMTVGNLTSYSKDTDTFSGDDSYDVAAGTYVKRIIIKPASPLTAFQCGYSPSGDELVTEQPVDEDVWTVFAIDYYFESSATIYLQGLTSSTQFILYYE